MNNQGNENLENNQNTFGTNVPVQPAAPGVEPQQVTPNPVPGITGINTPVQPAAPGVEPQQVTPNPVPGITEINTPVQPAAPRVESQQVTPNAVPSETIFSENLENKIEKQTNDILVKKAKNKSKKIIIFSLIIVVLLVIVGILFYVFNNPKSIFNNSINAVFKNIENVVNQNNYQYIEGKGIYNLRLNTTTNKYNFAMNTDYSVDTKNGLLNSNINTKYNDLPLLNFDLYSVKDGIYLYSANLYDKYVKLDSLSTDNSLTKEDMLVVVRAIKDATLAATDGEKITGSNLTINTNNQKIKTKKVSLTIDKNNIKNVSDKFIKSLTSNQKFLDIVSKCILITPDELKEELESLKSEIDTDMEPVTINIYIKSSNKEFVRFELNEGKDVFRLTKINDREYEYDITSFGNTLFGMVIYRQENNQTNLTLTFHYSDVTGTLSMLNEFKEANSFKTMEVSNSVKVEEITEDEMNNIYGKATSNEAFTKLFGNFMLSD